MIIISSPPAARYSVCLILYIAYLSLSINAPSRLPSFARPFVRGLWKSFDFEAHTPRRDPATFFQAAFARAFGKFLKRVHPFPIFVERRPSFVDLKASFFAAFFIAFAFSLAAFFDIFAVFFAAFLLTCDIYELPSPAIFPPRLTAASAAFIAAFFDALIASEPTAWICFTDLINIFTAFTAAL